VASNLATPVRALYGVVPDGVVGALAGLVGADPANWEGSLTAPLSEFSYWGASRVIPGTINEFPLFAFLNGDLHAHMMSTPFTLLAATLALSYFRTPEAALWRRRGLLALVSLVAAFVAVVNTWSFPTVLGVAWLAVAFAPSDPLTLFSARFAGRDRSALAAVGRGRPRALVRAWGLTELRWTGGAFAVAGVLTGLAVLASLPFWTTAAGAGGRSIALVADRSPLWALLVVHGGFLLVFVPYLLGRTRGTVGLGARRATGVLVGWAAVTLLAASVGAAALGLFVPLAVGAWLLLRARRAAARDPSFATVLVLAATGVVVLVDLVYLSEEAGPGRMNTVFKTYMQVWVLWAPAAGAGLASLLARTTPAPSLATLARADRASLGRVRPAAVLAVVLVVATSVYGGLALSAHVTAQPGYYDADSRNLYVPEEPTLDATQFVAEYHGEEAAAIAWLDDRPGQVTIAAAPGRDLYDWTNPESSLTGHSSVAGWAHEVGYRGGAVYRERATAADAMFTADDAARARLLAEYEVDYVYVGPREREQYGEDVSFEGVPGVTVEERFEGVTLYDVDRSALPAANASGEG
jgi:YYY domain-containing protein